ncbi:MAG: hypothetical protein JWM80_6647 [Cyanobacteria bacterium RYN_339]|nr:hypothetical protein [Cyanobacteria bacterium RYN_339]
MIQRTTRWRRRKVRKIRVTWIGQVTLLLILIDEYLMASFHLQMGGKFVLTLALVVLPCLAMCLWRAGLLPPERVTTTEEGP